MKKVFIAPMDWGLGHASRCIPLIRRLHKKGVEVIIGGDGRSGEYLKKEFPDAKYYPLPAYNIRYTHTSFQIPFLMLQVPRLLQVFRKEQKVLDEIITHENIDGVISDNRYGIYSSRVPSVFMTHQIAPLAPFRYIGYRVHLRFMKKFSAVWIPDFELPPRLSGGLSEDYPLPEHTRFIGTLSRFEGFIPSHQPLEMPYDIVAVLSGVEPQRTLLEALLISTFRQFPEWRCVIIQGKPESSSVQQLGNVEIFPFIEDDNKMYTVLTQSKVILSRGGYSSLMDFAALGIKKIILVPTPGQTEQEYLASCLEKQEVVIVMNQNAINLKGALKRLDTISGFGGVLPPANDTFLEEWLSGL